MSRTRANNSQQVALIILYTSEYPVGKMHEMVHYSFNTFHDEPPRPARSKVPNTNSSFSLDKGSSQTNGFKRTASFVVGQKLRESKWFSHEETKVLCAVLETGFIVEMKNQTGEKLQGIAIWTPGFGE